MQRLTAIGRLRFLARIHDARLLRAALWLCAYSLLPTAAVTALYVAAGGVLPMMPWLATVTFNPFIETLMLGAIIIQVSRLHGEHKALGLAALLMAAFHSLNTLWWGLTGLGLFLLHAYAFTQLYREDRQRAFAVPMLAHALHNAVVVMLLAAWQA